MTRFLSLPVLCAGLLCAVPLAAQPGFYIGGSVGETSVDTEFDDFSFDFDDEDTAWSGYAGVRATDYFAIEASYNDFGNFSASSVINLTETNVAAELTGYDVMAVLSAPLGPLSLYGKGGIVFWDAEATAQIIPPGGPASRFSSNDDGNDLAFGGGMELRLTPAFALRGEVEYFDIEDTEQVWFASLGLTYRF